MAIASSIFKSFDTGSDIVMGRIQSVSTGLWAQGAISQSNGEFFTSATQVSNTGSNNLSIGNGAYYWDVYDKYSPDSDITSEKFLSVAYGHKYGSGSGAYDVSTTLFFPTKAVYSQYKNLLLLPDDQYFSFVTGSSLLSSVNSEDIYVLNFASDKYKQRLDPGQFELSISGSKGLFSFIDDSVYQSKNNIGTNKTVYNIVRGTISSGPNTTLNGLLAYENIGLFYPTVGIVVLNPSTLTDIVGIPAPTLVNNSQKFSSNQICLLYGQYGTGVSPTHGNAGIRSITARNTEYIPTRHYFVRIQNKNFNYSNNPSFIQTGSNAGKWLFDSFATDPRVYITTIGLYNDNNDLLAVAKLSQPLQKSFDNEALIKVQLSW